MSFSPTSDLFVTVMVKMMCKLHLQAFSHEMAHVKTPLSAACSAGVELHSNTRVIGAVVCERTQCKM